ncbi:hypothetical protein [Luteimonas abyssi]|uniref:hypothetical protein n=1 Tax=Luteimonas abyssi TaxID=1247514 RepID=UPI000A716B0B|nr:hypothetical protein [Luteimonas abyssi]
MAEGCFQLLSPSRFGDFSIAMRGEDEYGTGYFVDGVTEAIEIARVDVDVDVSIQAFRKAAPDYLQTTKGVPLVSQAFRDEALVHFANDIDVVEAQLHLNGGTVDFFALRLKALALIDVDRSLFSDIGGIRILTDPVFDPSVPDFYLARDEAFRDFIVASGALVALIVDKKLRVEYMQY